MRSLSLKQTGRPENEACRVLEAHFPSQPHVVLYIRDSSVEAENRKEVDSFKQGGGGEPGPSATRYERAGRPIPRAL